MPTPYANLPDYVRDNVTYITALAGFLTNFLNGWQDTRMDPADIIDHQRAAADSATSATALLPQNVNAQLSDQQSVYIDQHLIVADQALVQQMAIFIDTLEHQNTTRLAGEEAQRVRESFIALFANRGHANPFDEMYDWLFDTSQNNLTLDSVEDTMHVISDMAAAMDGNLRAAERIAQRLPQQRTFSNPGMMAGYFHDSDSEPGDHDPDNQDLNNQDLNNQPQGPVTGTGAQGQNQGASVV